MFFNGVPFDQASDSEQLRMSMALAIAANPKVRICLLRDGCALDKKNMAMLAEFADKHKVQLWVERLDDDTPGFTIEDGEIIGESS